MNRRTFLAAASAAAAVAATWARAAFAKPEPVILAIDTGRQGGDWTTIIVSRKRPYVGNEIVTRWEHLEHRSFRANVPADSAYIAEIVNDLIEAHGPVESIAYAGNDAPTVYAALQRDWLERTGF